MTDKELDLVNKLVTVVGGSADRVLDAYTWYFIGASLVWALLGVILIGSALWIRKLALRNSELEDVGKVLLIWVVPAVLTLIGSLMLADNISDMVAPRAMAIHQLLKDIHGS